MADRALPSVAQLFVDNVTVVRDVLVDLLLLIVGIPSTYLLTQRRLARQSYTWRGKTNARFASLAFSLGLWLDGLTFAIFVEVFPRHWWEVLVVWFAVNYCGLVVFILSRRRASQN
jgi:hypothetical protein